MQTPTGTREAAAVGGFVLFLIVGGASVGLSFLPPGIWRQVALIVVAALLAATFFYLLISRLVRLFAGHGSFTVEAVLVGINVVLLLAAFAAIYAQVGLADTTGSGSESTTHSFADAAYYSVVTFTTLGYGDLQPRGVARVLACIETFVGYVVLGLLASTASSFVQAAAKKRISKDADEVSLVDA